MGKITKQHEDKVRSLIKSIKGGNDSAIEELFDLEKEHILHEVEQYSLWWPDTDEILEMAKSQLSYTAKNVILIIISMYCPCDGLFPDYIIDCVCCKRHLMSKSEEHGKTTIQDEDSNAFTITLTNCHITHSRTTSLQMHWLRYGKQKTRPNK